MPQQLSLPVPAVDEIHLIEDGFARGAEHTFKAGCDGIEIHCGHHYLMNQFLNPVRNERTDEYGGSMENRCRIVVETVEKIRELVPATFPVTVRLPLFDGEGYEGENTLDDYIEIAKHLEAHGVDAFNTTIGSADRTGSPEMKAGWRNEYYKKFKAALHVPIYGPNEVKTPDEAEQFLEEGVYDFQILGRAHSADPEWCNKARSGHAEDIRPCISCNYCLYRVTAEDAQIRCAVNPLLGREVDNLQPMKPGAGTVIVIGAGSAGIQSAMTLTERGATIKTNTALREIKDGAIVVEPWHGKFVSASLKGMRNINGYVAAGEAEQTGPYEIPVDCTVLSLGIRPDSSLLEELESRFENVVAIGDCVNPGRIGDATGAAFLAVKNL